MNVPVIFIFFNKMETTKQVFNQIKLAQPPRLYLVSDGPRASKKDEDQRVADLRAWVENNIDWECSVEKVYSETNLGCKERIVSGLTEVFSKEEYAIILEDDCCPKLSFFGYCEKLLEEYKNDSRIMLISGNNQVDQKHYSMDDDYSFSKNVWIWGWATWSRAWKLYDGDIKDWTKESVRDVLRNNLLADFRIGDMERYIEAVHFHRIDTWDYQWCYCVWKNNGLAIVPKYNLIDNLGFNIKEAAHTKGQMAPYLQEIFFKSDDFNHEIIITDKIDRNIELDRKYDEILLEEIKRGDTLHNHIIRKMKNIVKRIIGRPY